MMNWIASVIPKRFVSSEVLEILIRGATIAFLIQIAGNVIGYAGQIMIARWLGVSGYGVFTYLITWAQVFTIGALVGLDLGLVRFIPEYFLRQDWQRLRGILRWSRYLVLVAGIILAAASILILYFARPIQSSTITIVVGSLLIPLAALAEIQTQIIRSTKRIGWAYAPTLLLQPLLLLIVAYGFLRILGVLTDVYSLLAMLLAFCLIVTLQSVIIQRIYSGITRNIVEIYEANGWLKVSFPLLLNSVFIVILLRVDTLAVGYLLGPEEVGIYGAAVKTATIIGITLFATNTIVAPLITSYYTRRDMGGLQNVISLATLVSFGSSLVIGLGVVLFSRPILSAFGVEFVRGRTPLLILIVGQMFNVGSGSVALLMLLTGHERQSMIVLGCCALITCLSCFIAIPIFGITGAAIASIFGLSLFNVWSYRLVVRNLGIKPSIFYAVKKLVGSRTEI
jgi:O-antigen/teichoic acid export membrane protein